MSNVIPFPKRESPVARKPEYIIPLFGDGEVKLTVAAINLFGEQVSGTEFFQYANPRNLKSYKPEFVIECLKLGLKSEIFSAAGRKALNKILASVEEVKFSLQ